MRILAITDCHRERVENGSEVFCFRLIHALRRCHEVDVVARASHGSYADRNVDDGAFNNLRDMTQLFPRRRARCRVTERRLWPFEHPRQPYAPWCPIRRGSGRWLVVLFCRAPGTTGCTLIKVESI